MSGIQDSSIEMQQYRTWNELPTISLEKAMAASSLQVDIQSLPPLKEIATVSSLHPSAISSRSKSHKLNTHPRMSMTDSIRTRASIMSLPSESCF